MTGPTGTSAVRAALITGAGALEHQEFAWHPPEAGYVTVEIRLCGICGTEISSFRSGSLHSPAVCGHEWMGVVTAVGHGVTDVREGDRVVAAVPPACGRCPECLAGLADYCRVVQSVARGRAARASRHGGFARTLCVDAGRVHVAHPALSDEEAAQVEPATVAFHGVRRTPRRPGDTVVVLGAGPIGLLTLQLARIAGAGAVIVVEPSAQRRRLALELRADLAVAPGDEATQLIADRTQGLGPDVVYECSGAPQLLQHAVQTVRHGGTVSLLSYVSATADVQPGIWLGKQVSVVASNAFTHDDIVRTMSFMAEGRLQVKPLHTRTIGLTQLALVLGELAAGASDDVKVLVDPLH
jgi:(R,R)-butanediol dehydrogenase/meso-butanediol dehydrogenase/diacetyl reductase